MPRWFSMVVVPALILCATSCRRDADKINNEALPTAPAPNPAEAGAPTSEQGAPVALSDEDRRLIDADPTTLTTEERRQRAFALRRKIMQNPDSEVARSLDDLARAVEDGTVQPQLPSKTSPKFTAQQPKTSDDVAE